jgi:CubicO group peptidase (beta-lactamase class C family)
MTTSTSSQTMDTVLSDAVTSGAVPHVVAVAADRDGIVYEGASGPRAPGEDGSVDIDTLGLVVEAVCGRSLDEVISTRVTEPLDMTRTGFALDDRARAALVPVHERTPNGAWAASDIELPARPEYVSGSRGLYSTPRDYLVFQRMLLGRGTAPDGTTVLRPETVDAMFSNQIGSLDFPAEIHTAAPDAAFGLSVGPGYKWGHGLLINTEDEPGRRRAGSGAWMGLFNTSFWVDPAAGVAGAVYTQTRSLPGARSDAHVRGLRGGALRLAVSAG